MLALAELVSVLADPRHRSVLENGARSLVTAPRFEGRPLPGLYVGEAGIGAALLRAGQVLGADELIAAAAERGRLVSELPYGSPDLFNGTAGRLRFHLLLWDQTSDAEHLRAATEAGKSLLQTAEDVDGALRWKIPPGYEGLSGAAYLGAAHGASGIGDALLDLFEATDDERFVAAALRAGRWLEQQAIPVLTDGSGFDWPTTEGDSPGGAFWCHGATGIGRFFLHAAELGVMTGASDFAARAARTVAHGTRWAGPTQCHGLAGNIEFLLDMYQATGNRAYLTEARTLGRLLEAFGVEREGAPLWVSESPHVFSPDYMVGYAGVAVCLLRLSDPWLLPHQLSRRGFGAAKRRNERSTNGHSANTSDGDGDQCREKGA